MVKTICDLSVPIKLVFVYYHINMKLRDVLKLDHQLKLMQ